MKEILKLNPISSKVNDILGENYNDCGQIIFNGKQSVLMGGSGCGCSAVVLNSYILEKIRLKEYKKVLFVATGALLSTTSSQQGDTIPGIAHAVVIESDDDKPKSKLIKSKGE